MVSLPPGDTLSIRPGWFEGPLFTRAGDAGWMLDAAGVDRLAQATTRLGLHAQMPRRYSWYNEQDFRQVLARALEEYLRAMAWWLPDLPPRANGALSYIYDLLLRDGDLLRAGGDAWEDSFSGEHAAADQAAEDRHGDDEYSPWEDRANRLDIEQMIVASGRVDPFRLRPLVLITENAGRRQWWYGGWGVYDTDSSGRAGALLAIYGKHARVPNTVVWMNSRRYAGPMPSAEEVRWYGYPFDEQMGQHADVLCAITGVSLYNGTDGVIANAPRPPEAFVPAVPRSLRGLAEAGDVWGRTTAASTDDARVGITYDSDHAGRGATRSIAAQAEDAR
jgi:hypothetical protein